MALLSRNRSKKSSGASRSLRWMGIISASLLLVAGGVALTLGRRDAVPLTVGPTLLGMNLGRPTYHSSDWPYADIIRGNAVLMTPDAGGNWIKADTVVRFDEQRRPIDVPAERTLIVAINVASDNKLPGPLSCSISPGWTVRSSNAARIEMSAGGRFNLRPASGQVFGGPLHLELKPKSGNASLEKLSCYVPGASETDLFNPAFLAELKPFKIVRFMDAMKVNNAPLREWTQRPRPEQLFGDRDSDMPLEDMIALANQAKLDPWFTLPFDAGPDYYRNFASLVRAQLAPDRKVYVELSNEVWNGTFRQAKDARERGLREGLATDPRTAADRHYADRVRELMAIWSDVFADQRHRLVRIAAAQAASPESAETILSWKDTARAVDLLAIAPYLSAGDIDPATPPDAVARDILEERADIIVEEAIARAREQKKVAAKFGLGIAAYEAGQHFESRVPNLEQAFLAVNRDPRIGKLYSSFIRRWRSEIGGPLVFYKLIARPAASGSWGHKEYTGQPLSEAPKMRAIHEAAAGQ